MKIAGSRLSCNLNKLDVMKLIYLSQLSGLPACFEIGVVIVACDTGCYHKVGCGG
jgi:hypothetical protein